VNWHHDVNIAASVHIDRIVAVYMLESNGGEHQMELQCPDAQCDKTRDEPSQVTDREHGEWH